MTVLRDIPVLIPEKKRCVAFNCPVAAARHLHSGKEFSNTYELECDFPLHYQATNCNANDIMREKCLPTIKMGCIIDCTLVVPHYNSVDQQKEKQMQDNNRVLVLPRSTLLLATGKPCFTSYDYESFLSVQTTRVMP